MESYRSGSCGRPWRELIGAAALCSCATTVAETASGVLEEIVVTATRSEERLRDVPASVSSQDLDQIRELGFTYGSEEFRGVPGVFVRRGEGDGDEFLFVSIRGSSGTEGYLAMIDGVPFLGPDEEPLPNQMPYDALERVEIVKGPVSTLYGRGALYGAVNYISRSPREDEASLSVTTGSDDYYRGEVSVSRDFAQGRALLAASYEDYAGWREQGGKEVLNIFGRVGWHLNDASSVDVSLNYMDRDSEIPNAIPTTPEGEVLPVYGGPENFLGYGDPRNEFDGIIASARFTHDFAENLGFSVVGQVRSFDQDLNLNFYDPFGLDLANNLVGFNGYYSETSQDVYFTEATLAYEWNKHSVIAGVTGEIADSESIEFWSGQNGFTPACGFTFYLIQIDYTTGEVVNGDHPCFVVNQPVTRDEFENSFWGAFIQDEIRFSDRWRLTLGIRYDSFERVADVASPVSEPFSRLEGDASAWSPKAALSYLYGDGQVYVAYGRGFNSNFGTTFEWDALRYARPDNEPSTLDSIELGWKGSTANDRLQFELAAFYTEQTNRRQFVPNPDAETDPTAPGSRIVFGTLYRSRGFEASARLTPWEGGQFTAQYSWLDPEWDEYIVESSFAPPVDYSGTTPTGVAPNIYYLAAEQSITSWLTGRATLEIYDDYMITRDNSLEGGGYELLNLGVTLAPAAWRGAELDLALTNALDEEYYFFFGRGSAATSASPGVPRQVRASLQVRF